MGGLGEALLALIAEFGLPAVLGFLVDEGILPPWVLGETSGQAVESEPYAIERIASTAANEAINPFHGFSALLTRMNRLSTQIETDANALAEAIGNISINEQPSWYVPPTPGIAASDVWDVQYGGETDMTTGAHLLALETFAHNLHYLASFALRDDPFLIVDMGWKYPPD